MPGIALIGTDFVQPMTPEELGLRLASNGPRELSNPAFTLKASHLHHSVIGFIEVFEIAWNEPGRGPMEAEIYARLSLGQAVDAYDSMPIHHIEGWTNSPAQRKRIAQTEGA